LEQSGGLPIALAFEVTESHGLAIMIRECQNGFAQQLRDLRPLNAIQDRFHWPQNRWKMPVSVGVHRVCIAANWRFAELV
jgi:hypothetical protein